MWNPNWHCAEFSENRPILLLIMPFSDSVSFRQLPPAPVSRRFGPLLVRLADGYMAGGQEGDVGRSYLETQQAMGQICGKNILILVLLRPFF